MSSRPIYSMTGYCSVNCGLELAPSNSPETTIEKPTYRIELKSVNHRFLDLKLRLPKSFLPFEIPIRQFLQKQFHRGSIEFRLEKENIPDELKSIEVKPNLSLAASYYEALLSIQKTLGFNEQLKTTDIASMPGVIESPNSPQSQELHDSPEFWTQLEKALTLAVNELSKMRRHEGSAIVSHLTEGLDFMSDRLRTIRDTREKDQGKYPKLIKERIETLFSNYPVAEQSLSNVIESRVSQELALLLDRSDIQEELNRLEKHIDHFKQTLTDGGALGKKCDFLCQEMNREVNTLANKAQNFGISEQAIELKVVLEQIREQIMNLE